VFTRTRFKLLSRSNFHNQVLWLLVLNFTGSPIHPPSRCSQVPTRRLPQQPHSCVGRHPLRLGTRDWTTPCRVHHTITRQSRCRPSPSALAPTTKASCLRTLSRRRRLRTLSRRRRLLAPAEAITSHHPCAQTITSSQTPHRQHARSHCQVQSSLLTPDATAITCHPPADECGLLIAERNPSLLS
jgi:hypothetical protein